jgi:hypothetical protein
VPILQFEQMPSEPMLWRQESFFGRIGLTTFVEKSLSTSLAEIAFKDFLITPDFFGQVIGCEN